jgi:hypothetical protein
MATTHLFIARLGLYLGGLARLLRPLLLLRCG